MSRKRHEPDRTAPAPRQADAQLLPTLFDRLRDDAPHRQTEAPGEYAVSRAQMRDIIQRDLAFLLNATSIEDLIDRKRHSYAAASTINFGVPPLAGAFMASHKWAKIEQVIRGAIRDFEPRLIAHTVQVVPLTDVDSQSRYNHLAFEIRGMIRMDPYPLEFMVQSSLDLETSRLHAAAR
ncbi:type VI secretion system protein ImpF [Paraburkholderia sp. BL6669N2]|uniref:type VI secretion system baseplate subunit TssE n=1 Tax=Paraburkholderia sp. BL6669N2 TaxID=1938807 RepID=UPI000E284046|nr:type VI secretion system baseplate subunit TssE [Paraburkholderia sp. BL6669N2]REG61329.1 type VI secretion system protein ImpF [Paraburkholderia sp. BL6669N2]